VQKKFKPDKPGDAMGERYEKAIKELREIQRKNLLGGGEEHVERQHQRGKLTARERIEILLDAGTFSELGSAVNTTASRIDGRGFEAPGDGAVVGTGLVDGRRIAVYASDFTVLGGSIGTQHGLKFVKLLEMAARWGIPMVWLLDSSGGRLGYRLNAGWRDATQVGYYGLGMDTSYDDRANFRFNEAFGEAEATFRPLAWSVFTGAVAYDAYDTKGGEGGHPSIEQEYTSATAPGLGADPNYIRLTATAGIDLRPTSGIDYRPSAGYARRGGYYGVKYQNWKDVDDIYSFDQMDVDLIQHVPILKETWVLSLRGRLQAVLNDDDTVPYFLMPSVGSGSTLRGYSSRRFRDRSSVLMQAEWRWIPNRTGLDVALFFDAGQVASGPSDFATKDLETDVGIGVRFHGPTSTPLRIELAKGSEGWNLVFAGTAAF
jgi:hypothetical protein